MDLYHYANPGTIETALAELHGSFQTWSLLTVPARQIILRKYLQNFETNLDALAALITEEMGKPIKESKAEVEKCAATIKKYLDFDYTKLAQETISGVYKESTIEHIPVGVVYSIMPWNFPFYQAIRMIVPSLLGGNTVLLKHSEITPKVGQFLEKLLVDVWSKPLLKHLFLTHDVTEAIVGDLRVGGVSITGSTKAGFAIAAAAGKFMKRSVLELGGSDPTVICADADLSQAAKMVAGGRLMNTGQSCICIKRCLVDDKILQPFLDLLKKEFDNYIFGDLSHTTTTLGPLAHPKFKSALIKQIKELQKNTGAERIYSKPHGFAEASAYVNAEIYLLKKNSSWLFDQEFFAPLLLVIPFKSEGEAIEIANSTQFGLGASIWSKDISRAKNMAREIRAGQVAINDIVKSDMTLPFGGFKNSGLGRELSPRGIFEFTETKVISYS